MRKNLIYSLIATIFIIGCGDNNNQDKNSTTKENNQSRQLKESIPKEITKTEELEEVDFLEKEVNVDMELTPTKSDKELADEEQIEENQILEEEVIDEKEELNMKPENERLDEERIENEEE